MTPQPPSEFFRLSILPSFRPTQCPPIGTPTLKIRSDWNFPG
jgi:hypothetical protein